MIQSMSESVHGEKGDSQIYDEFMLKLMNIKMKQEQKMPINEISKHIEA